MPESLGYADMFDSFISVVHRVLCCRVLLNLRGAASSRPSTFSYELDDVSSVNFQGADTARSPLDAGRAYSDIEQRGYPSQASASTTIDA